MLHIVVYIWMMQSILLSKSIKFFYNDPQSVNKTKGLKSHRRVEAKVEDMNVDKSLLMIKYDWWLKLFDD